MPHGNLMHAFSHLLAHTRMNILSCKRYGFNSLDSDIKNTKAAIIALESSDTAGVDVTMDLSRLYAKIASLHRQNSLRWAQRAHLLWLHDGDQNTAFFHNLVCIRSHFNYISRIIDLCGNSFFGRSNIKHTFIQFYSNLWRDSNDNSYLDIFSMLPVDLPSLSDSESSTLFGMSLER